MNPWTITSEGRLGNSAVKQSLVMYSLEFGFTRRMLIDRELEDPDTLGKMTSKGSVAIFVFRRQFLGVIVRIQSSLVHFPTHSR